MQPTYESIHVLNDDQENLNISLSHHWDKFANNYRNNRTIKKNVSQQTKTNHQSEPIPKTKFKKSYQLERVIINGQYHLTTLMPNGTLIELNLPLDYTFAEIKVELFETAQRGPMFGVLGDPKIYIFNYVDKDLGQRKQIDDEQLRLIDVAPFCGFCELKKQEADSAALELDEQIGRLIGKPLTDFDSLHNPEVNEFRYRMRSLCEEIVKTRQSNSWLEKMRYAFPCEVDRMVEAPKYILQRISSDGYVHVQVFFDRPSIAIDMTVHHMVTADELIQLTIRHLANDPRQRNVFEQILSEVENESFLYDTSFESTDPIKMICTNNYYLLKIEGCLEYLLGNYRLIQYKMIQKILLSDQTIRLIAVRRLSIECKFSS